MRFMSDDEIEFLTGYKRPSKQCAWLRQRGWNYETNAAGKPRVVEAHCEHNLTSRPFERSLKPGKAVPNISLIR